MFGTINRLALNVGPGGEQEGRSADGWILTPNDSRTTTICPIDDGNSCPSLPLAFERWHRDGLG